MSSSTTSDGLRWRDDLGEDWYDVPPIPPLPAERSLEDDEDLEIVELSRGAVIQAPEGFVHALEDRLVLDLEKCV